MKKNIWDLLDKVHKPAQYLGNEINHVEKKITKAIVHVALCYPDIYELGIGNLSFRILYNLLNNLETVYAERVFVPEIDMQKLLKKSHLPLFSLETHTSLREFDFLGFTMQTELHITNVLQTLHLAHIHPLAKKRKKGPLVIGGGPSLVNPEPYTDFFDFFVIGDSEIVLPKILSLFNKNMARKEYFENIKNIDGVYIPSMGKHKVNVAVVPDLNQISFPSKQIVPLIHTSNNRGILEIDRGCLNNCRFCQAGYFYRPYRARKVDILLELAKSLIENTGFDDISLLSLSISNYDNLSYLLGRLYEMFPNKNINFSLPSLRIDAFGIDILERFQSRKKTGLTFALESMSQTVRRFLNKDLDYQNFLDIIKTVIEKGWRRFKIYLMFGFPIENEIDDNIKGMLEFVDFVRSIDKRVVINFHLTPFIPKPNTPFQWIEFKNPKLLLKDLNRIRKTVKRKNVQIKWHDVEMAHLESILALADRDMGSYIYKAWKKGAFFDTWDDKFQYKIWKPYIEKYRKKDVPWKHLYFGYEEDFFKNENEKAKHLLSTESCKIRPCYNCGVCYKKNVKNLFEPAKFFQPSPVYERVNKGIFFVLVIFTKLGLIRYLSQLDILSVLDKAFNAIDIPVRMSEGFSPHKKFSFFNPVPLGIESEQEIFLVQLTESIDLDEYARKLNNFFPDGMEIIKMTYQKNKKIFSQIRFFRYLCGFHHLSSVHTKRIKENGHVNSFKKINRKQYEIVLDCNVSIKKFFEGQIGIKPKNIGTILKTAYITI